MCQENPGPIFLVERKSTPPPFHPYSVFSSFFGFLCCVHELANQLLLVKETFEGCLWKVLRKYWSFPWPLWLSWLEHHPVTERLWVWFLVWADKWGMGLIPSLGAWSPAQAHTTPGPGAYGSNWLMLLSHINISFSPFLCPFFSLSHKKKKKFWAPSRHGDNWDLLIFRVGARSQRAVRHRLLC